MSTYPEIESKTIELKLDPGGSYERIMKTLIAFANTQGGKIIIGVQDKTRKISGVNEKIRHKIMEEVPNALFDAVTPPLAVNCYEQNRDNKILVIVQIYPGPNPPYFLKKEGYPRGVYIRNGAHTRRADEITIDEFELRRKRKFYEELLMEADMNELEIPGGYPKLGTYTRKKMLAEQLAGINSRNELLPSVAGMLLFHSSPQDFIKEAYIICSRFTGNTTQSLTETTKITGPLWSQIENSAHWVLSRLEKGKKLKGMKRESVYQVPPEAVREVIVNAAAHRNYQRPAPIRVMIFKDRIETISPGGFTAPIDESNLLEGLSQFRNPAVSRMLHKMNYMDKQGLGIRNIILSCRNSGLPEPVFRETGDFLKVLIFLAADDNREAADSVERIILRAVIENGPTGRSEIQSLIGLSKTRTVAILNEMISTGKISSAGKGNTRKYSVR